MSSSIHDFTIENLQGEPLDFSDYKGKKILLVNVASKCGLTGQYRQLQTLSKVAADSLVIVGCPANNFGGQEPGTNAEIEEFCSVTYGVDFPMTTKISVKGNNQHPLYQFVTQKAKNGVQDSEVQWNFQKYLFDAEGRLEQVFEPTVEPTDGQLLDALGINL